MTGRILNRYQKQALDQNYSDVKCEMQIGSYVSLIIIACFLFALHNGFIELKSHLCSEELIGTCRYGAMNCTNNTKLCQEHGCSSCIKAMDPFDQPTYRCVDYYQCTESDIRPFLLHILIVWILLLLASLDVINVVLRSLRKRNIWI